MAPRGPYRYGGSLGRLGCRCRRLSTKPAWTTTSPDDRDMNHPDATGVGPFPLNNPDGVRMSTALAYLEPCRHRLNLTVRGDVLARRVLFDGKRATGVAVESKGESFVVEGMRRSSSVPGRWAPRNCCCFLELGPPMSCARWA